MSSSARPSGVLKLPLHIVSQILGQLDTIPQLRPVIRSHSIFRDAFRDNLHSVCRSIIARQIPADVLPLVLDVLVSSYKSTDDRAARDLLVCLAIFTPNWTYHQSAIDLMSPALFEFKDYGFLSRHYMIADEVAKEVVPSKLAPLTASFLCWDKTKLKQWSLFELAKDYLNHAIPGNLLDFYDDYDRSHGEDKDDPGDITLEQFAWLSLCAYVTSTNEGMNEKHTSHPNQRSEVNVAI